MSQDVDHYAGLSLGDAKAVAVAAAVTFNFRLKYVANWGELKALLAEAEEWGVVPISKRGTKYSGRRKMYAFSGGSVVWTDRGFGHYGDDPEDPKTAYLYDDAVSSGSCKVKNLHRLATMEQEWF